MIKLDSAQLWAHDQDEALSFWTEKVGMEVRADVTVPEMGNFRWLTVGPPGQEDVSIVLIADSRRARVRRGDRSQDRGPHGQGRGGDHLPLDDVQRSYEELKGRGVEFVDHPTEQLFGIDCRSGTLRATTFGSPR